MLAMSHQIGSKIHIGNGFIEILDVRPSGRIRVGYTFDKSVVIVRDEAIELGSLDCGSLGQINPNPIATGLASGIDRPKNHHHED